MIGGLGSPRGEMMGSAAITGYRGWTRFRDWAFSRACCGAFASFGPHSVIQLPMRLAGESRISIGSDVFIGAGSWLQALGGESAIVIGDGTIMSGSCTLSAARSIRIGKKVLIARNVLVSDHGHEFANHAIPVRDQGLRDVRPVEIGEGAWLGQNVFVGQGVRIGRGAVVGANSVVLNDVPDYSVAVGAPARIAQTFNRDSVPFTEI
jgi:acetyltransferase-like isoleucine patch superfamily enzyme